MGSLTWKAYKVSQWLALCFASFFFSGSAAAAYCKPSGSASQYASCSEACAAIPFNANAWSPPALRCSISDPTVNGSSRSCTYDRPNPYGNCPGGDSTYGSVTWYSSGSPTTSLCSSGYTFNSTTMSCEAVTCPSGQHWDSVTSQCVPDNPCASGEGTQQRLTFIRCQDSNGNGVCDPQESPVFPPPDMSVSGCGFTFDSQVALSGGVDCFKVPPSQTMYCELTMVQTGDQLAPTSSNTPVESSQLGTCGANQSPMTIGGKTYCFDNQTESSSTTTTQTKDAQGNVTSSGTETKNTSVDTQNGTVTETTTHADGSQSSVTQDASTYCKNNPSADVCKAASGQATSSNSCTAPPTCSGDALLCANLRQQWETTCAVKNALTVGEGQGFTDPGNNGDLGAQDGVIVNENALGSSLDWHKIFFSETTASCGIADAQINVMGQSMTLPFSMICPYLDYLRAIIIVLASIASIRMFAMAPW